VHFRAKFSPVLKCIWSIWYQKQAPETGQCVIIIREVGK